MTRPTLHCKLLQPVTILLYPTVEIDEYADMYFVLQVGRINLADINRHKPEADGFHQMTEYRIHKKRPELVGN